MFNNRFHLTFSARNITKQVVDGLVYLHSHGILHRDIKLSNLLLTESFDVVWKCFLINWWRILLIFIHSIRKSLILVWQKNYHWHVNKPMKRCVEHPITSHRRFHSICSGCVIIINTFRVREIASRTPHSFATDVWSLGILIATLLTGRPPFDTDSKCKGNGNGNHSRTKFIENVFFLLLSFS